MENPSNSGFTTPGRAHLLAAIAIAVLGVAFAAAGIYVGEIDDAPGAALIGLLLMICAFAFSAQLARRKRLPSQKNE